MATIPEEIAFHHILLLLPSKSLVRFRCVCKSWHSFISHPSFLHLHRVTNHTNHHFLFVSHDPQATLIATSQPHVFSVPFHHYVQQTPPRATLLFTIPNLIFSETYVQCVNGLLCFHPTMTHWFSSPDSAFTVIANPTTREVVTLPVDESIGNREFRVSTQFGYDPLTDQFKVLRFIMYHDDSYQLKVFTVGATHSSWKVITPNIPSDPEHIVMDCLLYHYKRGICLNGAIHWKYQESKIVAFDVATERFRVMNTFYPKFIPHVQFPELVEIGGNLSLVRYSESELELWILKDYQAQVWEQKSIVLPSEIVAKKQVVFPLCEVPTGEVLLVPYTLPRRVRGIYYDIEKMSFTSVLVMQMSQPLWPRGKSTEVDIFFSEENFRFLK